MFSKYTCTPQKGLNFGPIIYDTASSAYTFELANIGEFPFVYKLFNLAAGLEAAVEAVPETKAPAGKKAPPPKKGAVAPPGALAGVCCNTVALCQVCVFTGIPCPFTPVSLSPVKASSPVQCLHQSEPCIGIAAELALGPFTISPSTGTIEAGAVATLSATFSAAGSQVFAEMLGIDVQNRSYTDCPEGIPFELIGESCIPGIDCQRVEGIFEEHVIKKELDAFNCGNNEYGMRDKVRDRSSAPDDVAHFLACGLPWWLGKDHHLGANARLTLGQSSQGTMTSSAVLLHV